MTSLWQKVSYLVPAQYRHLINNEGFKKYFKNTGWMFVGQFLSLAASFFVGAWVARYLGPANYGVFNYAVSFVGLFAFIAPLGVDAILYRELVSHPEKSNELLGTSFRLKLLGGLLAFAAAALSAYFLEGSYLVKIVVLVFSTSFIFQAYNVAHTFFNSRVESLKNVKAQVWATLISASLKIVLVVAQLGIIWLGVISLVESIMIATGSLYFYYRGGWRLKNWVFNSQLAKKLLRTSWLLMLSSAATFIYLKVDQVMVGRMLGATEVGFYAAAVKLSEIWYFIPGIICGSLFPAIVNAKKTGQDIYRRRLRSLYQLMIVLAIFIAIPLSLFSSPLMQLIFGGEYLPAAPILRVYIWSGIGLFLGTAISQYLTSEDRLKFIFILSLITMVANILLNLILIPRIGLTGAAWATAISYLLGPIILFTWEFYDQHRVSRKNN